MVEVAAAIGRLGRTPASRQRWRLALAAAATASKAAGAPSNIDFAKNYADMADCEGEELDALGERLAGL